MKDRTMLGARKSPTLIATVLMLLGGARLGHAEEPVAEPRAPVATPAEAAPSVPPPTAAAPDAPTGTLAAPTPAPAKAEAEGTEDTSWFARAPLAFSAGSGDKKLQLTLYGFVEADFIFDTTRSYNDAIGSSLVARKDVYDGRTGRTQFSMRNTRLGFMFESPTIGSIKPVAVLEGDFFGHQESPPTTSENTYFNSVAFRMRHAYVKLLNPYVNVLVGQTYDVFGWQNFFSPCSIQYLGLPNQVFSRNTQLRLSRTFNSDGAISVDIAAAAVRPAQRDATIPDAHGGVRFSLNTWKGISTHGNVGTVALPLSVGISAVVRQFKVNAFTPPPVQNSNSAMGWGLSVDALIPIIPAASAGDRSNRLTLIGSFVKGTGIADLITAGGGAKFPTLPNPAQANPPPLYSADIDDGLVSFSANGVLRTIDWQAFRAGLQYYLPPSGRLFFSANYTEAHSANLAKLFPKGGAEIELMVDIADTTRYADANLFWDATPAVRVGLSGQYTQVEFLDGTKAHNYRAMGQTVYQF